MTAVSHSSSLPVGTSEATSNPGEAGKADAAPRLGFIAQMAATAHLDSEPYGQVAADRGAGWKVALVAAAAGAAHGLVIGGGSTAVVLETAVVGVAVWIVFGSLVWAMARVASEARVSWPRVVRAVGFAAFPLALVAIAASPSSIPGLSSLVVGLIYGLGTLSVTAAVHAVLDISGARAFFVVVAAGALCAGPMVLAEQLIAR